MRSTVSCSHMGRKGAGRKAFVKSAMAHHSIDDEPETPAAAVSSLPEVAAPNPQKPAVEDKSVAFLKAPADTAKPETTGTADTAEEKAAETAASTTQPEASNSAAADETRGQLVQRHKRVHLCCSDSTTLDLRLAGQLNEHMCPVAGAEVAQGAHKEARQKAQGRLQPSVPVLSKSNYADLIDNVKHERGARCR